MADGRLSSKSRLRQPPGKWATREKSTNTARFHSKKEGRVSINMPVTSISTYRHNGGVNVIYGKSTCLTDRVSDGLSSLPSGCMEGDSDSTELPYFSLD